MDLSRNYKRQRVQFRLLQVIYLNCTRIHKNCNCTIVGTATLYVGMSESVQMRVRKEAVKS